MKRIVIVVMLLVILVFVMITVAQQTTSQWQVASLPGRTNGGFNSPSYAATVDVIDTGDYCVFVLRSSGGNVSVSAVAKNTRVTYERLACQK